ncbi:hypothetical protein PISMIDRAFT_680143, partial [Pisolithus microcarpus 441]
MTRSPTPSSSKPDFHAKETSLVNSTSGAQCQLMNIFRYLRASTTFNISSSQNLPMPAHCINAMVSMTDKLDNLFGHSGWHEKNVVPMFPAPLGVP